MPTAADLESILDTGQHTAEAIAKAVKQRTVTNLPEWKDLVKEYDPEQHPVNDKSKYPDVVRPDGSIEAVTRITYDLQRLAVKRLSELCFGVPSKRNYKPQTDAEQDAANIIEAIYRRNRIDSVNIERANLLFAGCEIATLWYATAEPNRIYGVEAPLKIRCATFAPAAGHKIYPIFDDLGDYKCLAIQTADADGDEILDAYTATRHVKLAHKGGWAVIEDEEIAIGKNPTLYCCRPAPAWEKTSPLVYELEWAMSRNGNYLRRNSRPVWVVCANEEISYGNETGHDNAGLDVLQYPAGSTANYVTWNQAIDNLKFYAGELRSQFFSQLQIPDWSYENIKSTPMSGEARKQLFIDAMLKVKDESGRLAEFLDRELNVVRAFAKQIAPKLGDAFETLQVDIEIVPFTIDDEKSDVAMLLQANGGRPLLSQRESIEYLGWSGDVERTLTLLESESEGETQAAGRASEPGGLADDLAPERDQADIE